MADAGVLKTTQKDLRGEGHFVSGGCDPNINNEQINLAASAGDLVAGTVVAKRTDADDATVVAAAGTNNVGDGTFAATPTVDDGAMEGVYTVLILEEATDSGDFEVRKPDGSLDGNGTIGAAYNGTVNFTLNDGATDFDAGDNFGISVTYNPADEVWAQFDQDATNGFQNAAGILWGDKDDLAAVQPAAASVRGPLVVNGNALTWPSDITAGEKAAAELQLKALGIQVRY